MTATKFTAPPSVTHTETPNPKRARKVTRPKPAGDATFAVLHDRRIAYTEHLRNRSGVPARSRDRRQPDGLGAGHGTARRNRSACDHRGPARSRPVGQDRGDYSLGAMASVLRDLLDYLGHRQAILVGPPSVVASRCSSPTSFQNAATDSYSSAVVASAPRRPSGCVQQRCPDRALSSRQSEVRRRPTHCCGAVDSWHVLASSHNFEPTDGGEVVGVRRFRHS